MFFAHAPLGGAVIAYPSPALPAIGQAAAAKASWFTGLSRADMVFTQDVAAAAETREITLVKAHIVFQHRERPLRHGWGGMRSSQVGAGSAAAYCIVTWGARLSQELQQWGPEGRIRSRLAGGGVIREKGMGGECMRCPVERIFGQCMQCMGYCGLEK
jgi:hypothetical protein